MTFALEDVRILDFTDSVAGPFTTRLLTSAGAEVIRIESRLHLGFRRNGPWGNTGPAPIPQIPEHLIDFSKVDMTQVVGASYAQYNHDKKSIALNLNKQEAREIFKKLAAISDVIVENFSYGVMQKWGFDYESLNAINDKIIVASIPSMGKGPHQKWTTWGMNLLSYSGFSHTWGHPATPMTERAANGFHGDYVSGTQAAAAIVAALISRAITGKGQFVEVAQTEATASVLGTQYLDYFVNGRVPEPRGNRHPQFAPYNAYRCSGEDRWCVITVFNETDWRQLCLALDHPLWTEDEKFKTMAGRLQNVDELDANIEKWTSLHTPHQVMRLLQSVGVAAGPVQNGEDLFYDIQLRESGFMMTEQLPRLGETTFSGIPVHMSAGQRPLPHRTSVLGDSNDYVYGWLLGLSKEEIERLEKEKVIF